MKRHSKISLKEFERRLGDINGVPDQLSGTATVTNGDSVVINHLCNIQLELISDLLGSLGVDMEDDICRRIKYTGIEGNNVMDHVVSMSVDGSVASAYGIDVNYRPYTTSEMLSAGSYIMGVLMKYLNLTDYQAAGIVGCWCAESGCNHTAYNKLEKAGKFPGSSANGRGYGAGLAQWSNSWKFDLERSLKKPLETMTLDEQLSMAIKDMTVSGGHKNRFPPKLREATDVVQATDIALRGYENGGNGGLATEAQIDKYTWDGGYKGSMAKRHGYAVQVLDYYRKKNA